jgi:hypothetical protein
MKTILINIILWTWCLPQTLLGFIVKCLTKKRHLVTVKGAALYETKIKGGSVSLGKYILLCKAHSNSLYVQNHEYGHFIQSLILGWLYLIVIGIPSFIWSNCFAKYRSKHNINYYSFYTEKWANKLGGNL